MSDWQLISTAPRDGRPFRAREGERVMTAFYKKNTLPTAVNQETLQVMASTQSYSSAAGWFKPTHWAELDASSPPETDNG